MRIWSAFSSHGASPPASPVPPEILDLQAASRDLQIGETPPLGVPADLIDLGSKVRRIVGDGRIALQALQEGLHPFQPEGRAKPAGKEPALPDQVTDVPVLHGSGLQIALQGGLLAHGDLLLEGLPLPLLGKVHTAVVQPLPELGQAARPVGPVQVHLVDKEQGGDMVALQQLPQGLGMALYAVGSADDQNGTVQHLEGALHLAGKIHMARGVQQGHLHGGQGEDRLLGEDGNAPLPLQGIGVQKSVLMVYPAQFAYRSTDVEHPL